MTIYIFKLLVLVILNPARTSKVTIQSRNRYCPLCRGKFICTVIISDTTVIKTDLDNSASTNTLLIFSGLLNWHSLSRDSFKAIHVCLRIISKLPGGI